MEPKKDGANHTYFDVGKVRIHTSPRRGVAIQEFDLRRPNPEEGSIREPTSRYGTRQLPLYSFLHSTERWRRMDSKASTFIRE